MRTQWKKQDDEEGKEKATEQPQGISMKEQRRIRAERRERWKIKKSIREKNKKERERKTKERNEAMVTKGKEKIRTQYTLRMWAIGGGPLRREGTEKEKDNEGDTKDIEQSRERKRNYQEGTRIRKEMKRYLSSRRTEDKEELTMKE